MKVIVLAACLICCTVVTGCTRKTSQPERRQLGWSGWIEETAAQRGYIKPGDFAQFGCPPGWLGVEDTAAALRGREVSTVYMGTDPPPYEGTLTCVAQAEFALPQPYIGNASEQPARRPLAPVWVEIGVDSTTIGFRSELPLGAPIYIGRDTPCGPRVIGVRLGDLLKWLVDPQAATKRDFLGMVSGGCPERDGPR
ncbi:MAG TPA: hypothetical protein VLD67_21470 [Vicinamibacterales bacterium]|nr:hypothetical protein [Vicinamibacterales bacterium]